MHSADKFSPGNLLDCLKISTEHEALELADRVESSMYTWRRKACISHSKSSWNKVKEFMADTGQSDKNYVLADRAETLLFFLKQRYPELSQTSLDTCKIQYNQVIFVGYVCMYIYIYIIGTWNKHEIVCLQDVGKAILESYSRVLEGLAFNIVAWIEDVLCADKSMRN
jgi:hypothetical protein